uniref:Uncharacterized protein n=2 Tax=Avena sativa TaxID=4498 RepID=A0ACD5YDW8_AVESA
MQARRTPPRGDSSVSWGQSSTCYQQLWPYFSSPRHVAIIFKEFIRTRRHVRYLNTQSMSSFEKGIISSALHSSETGRSGPQAGIDKVTPEGTSCLIYTNFYEGHNPASLPFSSTWSEWKRLLLFSLNGANMVIFISILLEALDLDDELSDYLDNFFGFMYMLTAVIFSKEGLYEFSAAEKAWALVGEKFYEITVLGAAFYFLQELLEDYYMSEVHIPRMEEVVAHVIREDTATEIFRFSVVSALLTVILQTFQCSVILAFYRSDDAGRPTDGQRDLNDATAMIAATNAQPLPEAEPVRRGPAASGRSDASSSNGGRALNLDRRTPRPRRQTRPHPKYDPRVWQL